MNDFKKFRHNQAYRSWQVINLPCYWRRNTKGCSSPELWVKDTFDVTTAILQDSLSSLWSPVFSWPPRALQCSVLSACPWGGANRQRVWPCRVQGCPSVLRREGAMSPGILGKGSLSLSEHPGGPPSLHSILIPKLADFQSLVCTITTPEIMVKGSGVGPRFYVNPHSMVWDFENPGPAALEENHQRPDHSSLLSPALINSTYLSALCSLL